MVVDNGRPIPGPTPGSHPVPRDPSKPVMSPEQIDAAVAEVLRDKPDCLADEARQLAHAHEILGRALG